MTETNQNVTILLDRLYNLTSEENVIIKETEENIENVLGRISSIEDSIAESKRNQDEQERRLSLFLQQKNTFEQAFAGLTDESFSALRDIEVNLEIGSLLSTVQEKSPLFIKSVMEDIEEHKTAISNAEEEKEAALAELATLRANLVVQNEQRTQLTSLLEQSLSPNEIERESLTASFVKKVLAPFGVFTTEEITRLTKLIMFPDEGLFEYDKNYEDRVAKGLIGLVEDEEPVVEVTPAADAEGEGEAEDVVEEEEKKVTPVVEEGTLVVAGEGVVEEDEEELTETKGAPTLLGENGQIKLDIDKIPTLGEGEGEPEPEAGVVVDEEDTSKKVQDEDVEGPAVVLNFQQIKEADLDEMSLALGEEQAPAVVAVVEGEGAGKGEPEPEAEEVVEEERKEEVAVEQHEEPAYDTKPAEELAAKYNLDFEQFKEVNREPLEKICRELLSVDEGVIERNYEILRSINLGEEAYKMRFGHMYLTDPDLNKKITLLRAKNISEQKIQLMIKDTNSGLRVPFEDMEKRIQSVENLHGKIDESNIYLICKDVSQYEENLDTLLRYGIDIDDKEARNHMVVLFESLNIPTNVEILKNYIISILKSNGKYALSVFWKKPQELLTDIDDLIEADMENIIATHPEVLGMTTQQILRRVKYCEAEGKKVFTDDMRSEPCEYILRPDKFKKEIGYVDLPTLVDRRESNDALVDVIGNSDYIEILLNTLDDYYANAESFATPEVVESMQERYEEFSHYLEENAKAELAGKYTYKIDGVCICKTKLERNLAIILNTLAAAKQPTLGVEREIVLVSALYNSRFTEEQLKKVAGSCLGFSEAAQEVKL